MTNARLRHYSLCIQALVFPVFSVRSFSCMDVFFFFVCILLLLLLLNKHLAAIGPCGVFQKAVYAAFLGKFMDKKLMDNLNFQF